MKALRDAVAAHSALTFVEGESQTIGGFGRNDRLAYDQRFGGTGEVAARVLLEAGTASGREPTTVIEISSYLSQFLRARGVSLGADDEDAFSMRLLHFRRTFVEKMFAIHGKVELLKRNGEPLGSYARHYYDLFQLAAQTEVIDMLQSAEYGETKAAMTESAGSTSTEAISYPKVCASRKARPCSRHRRSSRR
ncbi:nucleotidyl transferase AbiEii/AbiGii toxin family protein [Paludibaculum fermentans]|uniref:nucleotidyl transferase AbiEii/AbiGii toxin family protein n=1 Tax=Paludibaculum fermentans TaxID=1473598 RepID=UPI003EBFCA0C